MFLSIIIPIYGSGKFIHRCLESIFSQNACDFEVIVVGNNDDESAADLIKDKYPQINIIKNDKNYGAAFARNQGIKVSRGQYIMFLDSDAYLENNFFSKLMVIWEKQPKNVGALASKILYADSNRIFSCGLKISPLYRVYDWGRNKKGIKFNQSFIVDGPNSCCAIFKRESLASVNSGNGQYFDNDFFFLFEDADLALRFKSCGWITLFVPELVCGHYGQGSAGGKKYRQYLCFRNRWFIILKNKKGIRLLVFFIKSFLYDISRTLYFFITNNEYFFIMLRDIRNRINDEKNNHI